MKRYIVLSITMLLGALFSLNSLNAASLAKADSLYKSGDFADAVVIYEDVLKTEGASSDLLYNIGNAYARGGDYGQATLYYLRALRLNPDNLEAQNNLAFIDSKVMATNQSELRGKKYSLDREDPSFFSSIKLYLVNGHLSNDWAIWGVVCFLAFIICLTIYIFSHNVAARKIGFFGGFVFVGLAVIMIVFAFMASSYHSDEGVVISPKIKLMSDASAASKEGPVNLTRGTRMVILDSVSSGDSATRWYKVRLNSDFVGWIPSADFTPVSL